ncbi:hypothetical protein VNO78_04423 [Psophocarpus tetragonolobus]|uniref:Argonaute linker 1 domain-containing protein n=1 Tax=Psophocarpus tetragonolobus TaxID=3891 RepID=A0AAN9T4J2_PSOTE
METGGGGRQQRGNDGRGIPQAPSEPNLPSELSRRWFSNHNGADPDQRHFSGTIITAFQNLVPLKDALILTTVGDLLLRLHLLIFLADSLVPKLEKLQISKQLPASACTLEKKYRISPIHRPDNGGTLAILTSRLLVNHFPVKFDPEGIIMHYNVSVKPKVSSKFGQPQKLSKSDLSMIREKLFSDDPERLPLEMTAHDGAKNIYNAVQLPEETFTVEISEGEDEKIISYSVTLTLINKLRFRKLMDYLSGHKLSIPGDILQGMDVVVKENPARRTISVGRHYYPTNPPVVMKDLHHGIIAIGGFQHSLKPTSQGLSLCVDYSVLPFRKQISVLDFLHERINNFKFDEFEKFRKFVEDALIGLKV